MTDAPNLAPEAFRGTAEAYLRGRPPYPPALLAALIEAASPSPPSALLDLACGPGRIALDLADAFERVVAIDLEPEMVAVGRREAARREITNIVWSVGRAEDAELPTGAFDLVTVGEAFHRLDQALIAQRALAWLKPGGCLAAPGCIGILEGAAPWQKAAAEVAHRWMARAFPGGWAAGRPGAAMGPRGHERVLERAGFVEVDSRTFTTPLAWSRDAVVSYFRSTSVCSAGALGEHSAAFEREVRAVLGPYAERGTLREQAEFGFTLGRKPRA